MIPSLVKNALKSIKSVLESNMALIDVIGESVLKNSMGTKFLWVYDTDEKQHRYYCVTHDVSCDLQTGRCFYCNQKVDD